jgi:hypothetical protein
MSRVTLKSSTIFISVGSKTEVYRSVNDVPPPLRKLLEQSTSGIHSATILIADRKGKEEIVRAVRGLPSGLRSRLSTTLANEAPEIKPAAWLAIGQFWIELLLPPAIGLAVWLLFSFR